MFLKYVNTTHQILHGTKINKNLNMYLYNHCHYFYETMIHRNLPKEKVVEKPKIPESYKCPVSLIEPDNYCRTTSKYEDELDVKYLFCFHCRQLYSVDENRQNRRYNLCLRCYPNLLTQYVKNKGEISFSEFVEHKKVLDVLTLYT